MNPSAKKKHEKKCREYLLRKQNTRNINRSHSSLCNVKRVSAIYEPMVYRFSLSGMISTTGSKVWTFKGGFSSVFHLAVPLNLSLIIIDIFSSFVSLCYSNFHLSTVLSQFKIMFPWIPYMSYVPCFYSKTNFANPIFCRVEVFCTINILLTGLTPPYT